MSSMRICVSSMSQMVISPDVVYWKRWMHKRSLW